MHSGLSSRIVVFALMGLAIGFTACAKYPVVSDVSAPAPSATARPPAR